MTKEPQPRDYVIDDPLYRWVPVILLLIVAVIALTLWGCVGLEPPHQRSTDRDYYFHWTYPPPLDSGGFVHELRRRVAWDAAYCALMTLGVCTVWASHYVAGKSLEPKQRRRWGSRAAITVLLAVSIVLLDVICLELHAPLISRCAESITRHFQGFTLAEDIIEAIRQSGSRALDTFVTAGNLIIAIPPVAMAFAATAVLHVRTPEVGLRLADSIVYCRRNLDLLLYVGAALLVSGILEVRSLYSWGGAYLSPEEGKACLETAKSLSLIAGSFFSFILMIIYLPATFVLISSSGSQAPSTDPDGKEKQDYFATFFRVVAILAPILAGAPLTDFVQRS